MYSHSAPRQVLEEVRPSPSPRIKTCRHLVGTDIRVSVRRTRARGTFHNLMRTKIPQSSFLITWPFIKSITSNCLASISFSKGFPSDAEEILLSDPAGLPPPGPPPPHSRAGRGPRGAGSVSLRVVSYRTPVQGPSAIDHLLMFSDLLN